MTIHTPDWVKHAIFYQIFPDRFARSPRTQHPKGISFKPWGSPPDEQGYQGGDLRGIVDNLDYLQTLGITALYLNPIFASAANHRYHPFDYYQVDPLLGGNDALRELLDEAHRREMRGVLDGVFNHVSRGFWPFHHVLENGGNSPYLDWFIIYGWPLRPYSSTKQHPPNYKSWWSLPGLPELNTANPGVREFLFGVARHWIEFGIDGWRLDVPFEIDDDSFWQEFRQVVKAANPDAYLCGEVWWDARRWLQGDQFDAVMNYLFMDAALSFFGAETLRADYKKSHLKLQALDAQAFAEAIDHMHGLYDWEVNHVQLNLLDSHDTARALWILGEDTSALKLCALFQMTMPGAPCIYYGDEIGLSAADDPHCRGAFPWEQAGGWNRDLLAFYQQATALRRQYPVLRTGTFRLLKAHEDIYAFTRQLDQQTALVMFNTAMGDRSYTLSVPKQRQTHDYFQAWPRTSNRLYTISDGRLQLTLPGREAVVLVA
ncbi:alpha-amylase [candidate division KSB3 bacterium]|uniref:Alpha-amylase n=1 Tax=candidate division KSB3 bacterium TaxID=2044937 RepID=A0A9D5JS64_9BACT|nr:alpha-amylase [candidate division KSB3 bacterium]MBD3323274.1 alpha-amylase [candidate division KSB3 bacterium]